jgi:hypothetical protein
MRFFSTFAFFASFVVLRSTTKEGKDTKEEKG